MFLVILFTSHCLLCHWCTFCVFILGSVHFQFCFSSWQRCRRLHGFPPAVVRPCWFGSSFMMAGPGYLSNFRQPLVVLCASPLSIVLYACSPSAICVFVLVYDRIRTHNLNGRAAVDLCLRPRDHWDRRLHTGSIRNNALYDLTLIKMMVACFVDTGDFLIRYSNDHTK
jgi:hypothetical protein